MPHPLFAYGTLQDHDMLAAVLGRSVPSASMKPALAPGYKAVLYPNRTYPALVAAAGSAAPGMLVEGLDMSELSLLDEFEGAEYWRLTIIVECRGATVPAWVYFPTISIDAAGRAWSLSAWQALHKPDALRSWIENP